MTLCLMTWLHIAQHHGWFLSLPVYGPHVTNHMWPCCYQIVSSYDASLYSCMCIVCRILSIARELVCTFNAFLTQPCQWCSKKMLGSPFYSNKNYWVHVHVCTVLKIYTAIIKQSCGIIIVRSMLVLDQWLCTDVCDGWSILNSRSGAGL